MGWKDARILKTKWRLRPFMWGIVPFELLGTVGLLVLFALAQPDLYRTELWTIGSVYKWNSNPNVILYSYANNAPYPKVPFVWTTQLTNFNVAISVISLFIWLAKLIGLIMHWWTPLVGTVFGTMMTVLYAISVYGQMGPDYLDPRYPSPVAWYIRKGCSYAQPFGSISVLHCNMAVGTYAATVIMLTIYTSILGISVFSLLPLKDNKADKEVEDDDSYRGSPDLSRQYEMTAPKTTATATTVPFTPRTQAFHALDRRLPLRDRYQ